MRFVIHTLVVLAFVACTSASRKTSGASTGSGVADRASAPSTSGAGAPAQTGSTGGVGPAGAGAGDQMRGSMATQGGSDGSTTVPDAGAPVDYSLGGFNQDLQAPTVDCSMRTVVAGCFSFSGTYNGKAFNISCSDDAYILDGLDGAGYVWGCDATQFEGQRFDVEVSLARALANPPPTSFSRSSASAMAYPLASRPERNLEMYPNRDYTMYPYSSTHDLAFRFAGLSELPTSALQNPFQVTGTFAFSFTPKATCAPDAMGFGCDEIRARGNFRVIPTASH